HNTPAIAPRMSGSARKTVSRALDPSGIVLPEICQHKNPNTSPTTAIVDHSANRRLVRDHISRPPHTIAITPPMIAPTRDGIGTDVPFAFSLAVKRASAP